MTPELDGKPPWEGVGRNRRRIFTVFIPVGGVIMSIILGGVANYYVKLLGGTYKYYVGNEDKINFT